LQVATCSLPVQKSCKYRPNGILRYNVTYSLVGGVHAPKKIFCLSMDGEKHVQLCKGLDDLHLDAVMQQVFTIMNRMLLRNAGANKRKLHVRTYNVCPLSQRSGLIEWCKNTTPIGEYLHACHPKYNPQDATPKVCRTMMQHVETTFLQNKSKRIQNYLDVCSTFRPVFHNFFLEYFTLPAEWFVRRLAYTRR
jgi:serine-protein kinase ATM